MGEASTHRHSFNLVTQSKTRDSASIKQTGYERHLPLFDTIMHSCNAEGKQRVEHIPTGHFRTPPLPSDHNCDAAEPVQRARPVLPEHDEVPGGLTLLHAGLRSPGGCDRDSPARHPHPAGEPPHRAVQAGLQEKRPRLDLLGGHLPVPPGQPNGKFKRCLITESRRSVM